MSNIHSMMADEIPEVQMESQMSTPNEPIDLSLPKIQHPISQLMSPMSENIVHANKW